MENNKKKLKKLHSRQVDLILFLEQRSRDGEYERRKSRKVDLSNGKTKNYWKALLESLGNYIKHTKLFASTKQCFGETITL